VIAITYLSRIDVRWRVFRRLLASPPSLTKTIIISFVLTRRLRAVLGVFFFAA